MRRELILFGLVGVAAFAVDAGILYLVMPVVGAYWGRALSFFCAVFTTWLLNRHLTFKNRYSDLPLVVEFIKYIVAMLGGGSINYILYAYLLLTFENIAAQPIWGVASGSGAGMMVNFILSRVFVFKNRSQKSSIVVARQVKNHLLQ